ncbi:MAG: hypothetical protein IKP88_12180 [Lachnospiraceae bacterium]|nr:hypothetical protein [Lachnospiraceae bacterium]
MSAENEYNEFVPRVHFELIPIKNLVSNQKYQRELSMIHVNKAVLNFDLNQINPIKVSRRDGTNYVFNGQHTAEIVAMASGSRDTPVWCMIYDDLEYTMEADIFANQMKNVKALTAVEIFNANCEAGNEDSLIIRDMIESYDMKVGSSPLPGNIMAIGTIETIYYKYGYKVLDRVLKLIIGTWEGEQKSFSANILNGVTRLICAYGTNLDDDVFKEKLGIISIKEITKVAKERRAGSLGYAEAMLIYYNKKLKHSLQWNLLYVTKNDKKKAKMNDGGDDISRDGTSRQVVGKLEDNDAGNITTGKDIRNTDKNNMAENNNPVVLDEEKVQPDNSRTKRKETA